MLPNLRLTIAAVFASILVLCCGFAMFATVRVSHAPLARASSAAPGLQLSAANGPRLPLNLAAAEPFDHRFVLEQQAGSGVRALAYAAPQPADAPVAQPTAPAADNAEQVASKPKAAMNPPVAVPAPPAAEQAAPAHSVETATIPPAEETSQTKSETAPPPSRQVALAAAGTGPEIKPEQETGPEVKPEVKSEAKPEEGAPAPAAVEPPPPASVADIKLPDAESPPEQGQTSGHLIEIASLPGNLAAESAMAIPTSLAKHADKKTKKAVARPRRYVRIPAVADDGFGQAAVTAQPVRTRSRVTASPATNDWNSGTGGPYVAAPH